MSKMASEMKQLLKTVRAPVSKQIEVLQTGIPRSAFTTISEELTVPQRQLAEGLGLNERTLRTRKSHELLTEIESEKIWRVVRVYWLAISVLGDQEGARKWLNSPIKSLGNQRPLDLLETDLGTGEVVNVLNAIEWGVYL